MSDQGYAENMKNPEKSDRDLGNIPSEISRLEETCGLLDATLGDLGARLEAAGVLLPQGTEPSESDKYLQVEPPPISELATRIQRSRERINLYAIRASEMTSRLDF